MRIFIRGLDVYVLRVHFVNVFVRRMLRLMFSNFTCNFNACNCCLETLYKYSGIRETAEITVDFVLLFVADLVCFLAVFGIDFMYRCD